MFLAKPAPGKREDRVSYREFVDQVRNESGTHDPARLERAIATTLEALGERLRAPDAKAVAQKLPPELGRHLLGAHGAADAPACADDIVSVICSERGIAAEELRAICRVLAESLDEQGRAQLRMQPLCSLFVH